MSKKTAFIIIIVFVLLIGGGFFAFYFYSNQGQGNNIGVVTDNRGNIFPPTPGANTMPNQNNGGTTSDTSTTTPGNNQPVLRVRELSTRPAAGAVAMSTSSDQTVVRFIERGSGNAYEVHPDIEGEVRLSNTTIPKVEEALWNKTGMQVLARYVADDNDTIKTYSATLTKASDQPEGELKGSYMTENIRSVAENPDQNKLFYFLQDSGGSTGIISGFDGGGKLQIFDSPLAEWVPDWPTASFISLTTKASAGVPGFLFLVNAKTGAVAPAISGINGLTAKVSPTGTLVAYSETKPGRLSLKIFSLKSASNKETSVQTLPEKCVWSKNDTETLYCSVPSYLPDGAYPDMWYKGLVSFSDEIWKIDATTGAGTVIAKLINSAPQGIDGTNLFLSPNEDYLLLTNKKDFHLWSIQLKP